MAIDLVTAYGSIGFVMLLGAFFLNRIGKLDSKGLPYNVLNAVGALILTHYAHLINSVVFMFLEGAWAVIGIYGLYSCLTSKK